MLFICLGPYTHATEYTSIEQTTKEGTFYAYSSKAAPHIWFMGLPNTAAYAYDAAKIRFYIRPHGHTAVYSVNLPKRLNKLPKAKTKRQNISGLTILKYNDLHQWEVSIGKELCGIVLTSRKGAQDLHLNFTDQVNISQGLRAAFSQGGKTSVQKASCKDFNLPYAVGRFMGYALLINGTNINASLTKITEDAALPKNYLTLEDLKITQPLNDQGKADLLFASLSTEEKALLTPQLNTHTPKEKIRLIKAFYKAQQ